MGVLRRMTAGQSGCGHRTTRNNLAPKYTSVRYQVSADKGHSVWCHTNIARCSGSQPFPHFDYANKPLNSLACDTAVANAAMSGASLCSGMLGMSS